MNWRTILMLILLAALVAGAWWLNGFMENQGWVVVENQKWVIAGTGWETLKYAWPVAVIGVLIGGGILYVILGYLYLTATEADHENEIARIKAQKALSDDKAEKAQIRADNSIKSDREALRAQERQLMEREERFKRLEAEAVNRVQVAEERVKEAEKTAAKANTKKQRAEGAMARLRSKPR